MKITVGVTSAGSAPAVAVIKALKQQKELDFKIISFDMDRLSSGFYLGDKSHLVPSSQESSFIDSVLRICQKEKISVLIPIIDEELLIFAKNQERFQKNGIKLIVNNKETVELAKDKFSSYKFCLQNDILVPRTALIDEVEKIRRMRFPLIIKPLKGRGSLDTYRVEGREELFYLRNKLSGLYIVQEFIEGREYTVDIVASPAGEILLVVPRERMVTKAGMSYKGRTVSNARLSTMAKRVAEKFGINGPANIQFKIKEEKIYLIEVNPKFAAGLPLTVASGVNIPLVLIKLALGFKVAKSELRYKTDFYMLRYWNEIFVPKNEILG